MGQSGIRKCKKERQDLQNTETAGESGNCFSLFPLFADRVTPKICSRPGAPMLSLRAMRNGNVSNTKEIGPASRSELGY